MNNYDGQGQKRFVTNKLKHVRLKRNSYLGYDSKIIVCHHQ